MSHLSGRPLKKNVSKKLEKQLLAGLEEAFRSKHHSAMLDLLLTKTEKLMLAKRLALFGMLSRGVPSGLIAKRLKLTNATISRYISIAERGKNEPDPKRAKPKPGRHKRSVIEINFGLMPAMGGNARWTFFNKINHDD